MDDLAWRNSYYGEVYEALILSLEPSVRNVRTGTEGLIGRALCCLRVAGETDAVRKLEQIALTISRLQESLRSRSEEGYRVCRQELTWHAREWLRAAPMFPQHHSFASSIAA